MGWACSSSCLSNFSFLPSPPNPNLHLQLQANQVSCPWRRSSYLGRAFIQQHTTTTTTTVTASFSSEPYFDYLEEEDVITFLNPPKHLIPLNPSSFNPALYLSKKIGDIPEQRRHRLLSLLNPSLISRAWEIAGTKYDDPKVSKKITSNILSASDENDTNMIEFWSCCSSAGPAPIAWFNHFKKAVFHCKDGRRFGRFIGGSLPTKLSNYFPMYFMVKELNEVMSTEQPCDMAYEFGDGVWDLHDYPQGFPKPAKHPWPFSDQVVVYIRQIGPGVLVGQAWQEGDALEQVPKKLCGEILMVKDYTQLQPVQVTS